MITMPALPSIELMRVWTNARDSRFLSALALYRKLEVHADYVDLR